MLLLLLLLFSRSLPIFLTLKHTHTFRSRARALLQAKFFTEAVGIAKAHKAVCEGKGLKKVAEFRGSLADGDKGTWPEAMRELKKKVVSFARSFPVVGFDKNTATY